MKLGLGLSLANRGGAGGGAAPSGIPVASTESVLITTSTFSYTFPKDPGQDSYVFLLNCGEESCEANLRLEYPNRNGSGLPWRLYDYQNDLLVSTNASTDPTTIPTSGWSPSITITAAPSGINPATPANLLITFADQTNGFYSRSVAGVHTAWYQFIDGGEQCNLEWTGTIWRLTRIANGDFAGPYVGEATNDTGNINSIPTTGWVYTITDYGTPTVTITAA